jgi:hypothetical protein
VLQAGGNTVKPHVQKQLAETLGTHPKSIGPALEQLKQANGLGNNHHGKIMSDGSYADSAGNIIDNIANYLP